MNLMNTILLEKSTIGAGSTGRSSGAIRMHYSTQVNASLAHESLKVFANFSDLVGGDVGFVKTGYHRQVEHLGCGSIALIYL